jgi:hypothetical protein
MADELSFTDNVRQKEYEFLRNEISATLERRNQIIVWGGGASGAALGFGIKEIADAHGNADIVLGGFIASVIVPILLWAIVYAWLFEYERASRAGAYCREVEADLKSRFSSQAIGWIGWETWLVSKRSTHMGYGPYILFVGLFSMACSIGGTLWAHSKLDDKDITSGYETYVLVTLVVLNVVFALIAYMRLRKIRHDWLTVIPTGDAQGASRAAGLAKNPRQGRQ